MITKMTSNMSFIVVMMVIVLLSFGVSRKAILDPDQEPSWSLARDIVFQPYWMIFGEVYAQEHDSCAEDDSCPPAYFLSPLLQAVYMFFQYIIMVNILIAFFNNIYFDMASISNKLWKYNRYRYIRTYQERPWLPPPLILLSHMALAVRKIYRRFCGDAEGEEKRSGLKLYLGFEDKKKLYEFEEKCVEVYFHEKNKDLHSTQMSRIGATAERADEMCGMVGEVSEKVNFIQDSLSELDGQLGQLQDLSALAVDTLTLLSASDSLHQEEARLAQCHRISAANHHVLPHSWALPHRGGGEWDVSNARRLMIKGCKSTPPSLLKGFTLEGSRQASQKHYVEVRRVREGKDGEETAGEVSTSAFVEDLDEKQFRDSRLESHDSSPHFYLGGQKNKTPSESAESSRCGSPTFLKAFGTPHNKPWTYEPYLYSSQQEAPMEEGEEDAEEEEITEEDLPHMEETSFPSRHSSHWRKPPICPRWTCAPRERPFGYCRSLSSSMENMAFSGAPLSPTKGSFPSLKDAMNKEFMFDRRGSIDDAPLRCSKSQEWAKSPAFCQDMDSRGKIPNRKTVKIKDSTRDPETLESRLSDAFWKKRRRLIGGATCWSASASLSQLNSDSTDSMQKQLFSHQEMWSPTHSAWNSRARSVGRRSSLQSGFAPEVKSSSFQSSDNMYPHFSAMERNNLMRLAHNIPFTPVSILGGEEVSVFSLTEVCSEAESGSSSVSSWSSRGLSAMLKPLSSEEGSLDGGLRQGCRVLCTWAEQDVLKPGQIYVVKAFKPEVIRAWQRYFHGSTALQLCLREIQQQRAAQKMIKVFNQIKPKYIDHSPRFLDVSLVLWHSNGHWLTIERNLIGNFRKYNNNTGEEIAPCCSLEEVLLAFSHWTYEYSRREMLVLDIQGVGEQLTDPTVVMADDQSCSRGEMLFGPDNLGEVAISGFLQKHSCNSCCRRLGLKDLRRLPGNCENNSDVEQTSGKKEGDGH